MNSEERATRSAVAGARQTEVAVLAGGCFWGVEEILRDVPGVIDTDVGYTGGWLENPTYDDTHDSKSGHAEAIRVTFDPSVLSYEDLLEQWFFRLHDPTTLNRQGNDVGTQYRSAIFPQTPEQTAHGGAGHRARRRRRASGSGRSRRPSSPPPPGTAPRSTTRTTCASIPAATAATTCATSSVGRGPGVPESAGAARHQRRPLHAEPTPFCMRRDRSAFDDRGIRRQRTGRGQGEASTR